MTVIATARHTNAVGYQFRLFIRPKFRKMNCGSTRRTLINDRAPDEGTKYMAIETLGAALRQINRLFADGVVTGLSDAQLLERFLAQGDAGAFEVLVARHGPMVLSVCRGILRDPNDAEDAFQATFLVLVKKGGTIRGRDALGGWLYQVAHRVAIQANIAAARRRRSKGRRDRWLSRLRANGPAASDDLLPALHEEIARLPEKYRLAVVLCDLEGMTQAQAAGQLHWSERTLHRRLAEARARLKRRLARRGLAPDGATSGRGVPARGAGRRAGGLERSDRSCRGRHRESHSDRRGRLGGGSAIGSGGAQDHVAPKAQIGISHPAGGRPDRLGGVGRPGLARG